MSRKAFTLVEVLVVICITSLLAGVLLPVLARARQQSKSLICMSNMRQMYLAAQAYTINNDGYYPMAYIYKRDSSSYIRCEWDFSTVTEDGDKTVEPGLLWQGQMIEKVQQCPEFNGKLSWGSGPFTGYNYNSSYLGGSAAVKDGRLVPGTAVLSSRAIDVKKPDRCAIFGDGGDTEFTNGANKFMRSPFTGKLDEGFWGRYAGTQGFRHLGKTNVCYCDGSVRTLDEIFTETDQGGKKKIEKHNQGDVKVGFLSPDNGAYDLN